MTAETAGDPATTAQQLGATGVVVLRDGVEIATAGETSRPVFLNSVRKSLLSALIGIAVDAGEIALDATLADFGIDDHPTLTDTEKGATVADLLTCRSGVYLPVPPHPLAPPRPERGAHAPGTNWLYSNWDFNALGSIYERATGKSVYLAFDRLLARPLGLQDWDAYAHSGYQYEPDALGANLTFPTYTFQMSARDIARVGSLYLQGGVSGGAQVIPADWIADSTAAHVRTTFDIPTMRHYGYLWWVAGADGELPADAYTAWGISGSYLTVIPSAGTVIAVVTDPAKPAPSPELDFGPATMHVTPPAYADFVAEVLAA